MQSLISHEFEQFVEALPGLRGRYVITNAQARDWKLQVIDLEGVTLMQGQEGAGRIYNGLSEESRFHVYFVLDGPGQVAVDGRSFDAGELAWIAPQSTFHTATRQPIRWINVSLDAGTLRTWHQAHEDEFPERLLDRNVVKRACAPSTELLSILGSLVRSPEQLREPAIRRAARDAVLDATMRRLLPLHEPDARSDRCANRRHIVDRALQRLESLADEPVDIAALCHASGASERTLRNAFQAYFGVGPHRYLMLHRLHAIRDEIRQGRPQDSVTSLCSRFGIWDFGRFARAYKNQFGILPSQDLYAAPSRRTAQHLKSAAFT